MNVNDYEVNSELKDAVSNKDIDKLIELVPVSDIKLIEDYCDGYEKETDEKEKQKLLFYIESMHIRKALDQGNIEQIKEYIPSLNEEEITEYCNKYKKAYNIDAFQLTQVLFEDAEYDELFEQGDKIVLELLNKSKQKEETKIIK